MAASVGEGETGLEFVSISETSSWRIWSLRCFEWRLVIRITTGTLNITTIIIMIITAVGIIVFVVFFVVIGAVVAVILVMFLVAFVVVAVMAVVIVAVVAVVVQVVVVVLVVMVAVVVVVVVLTVFLHICLIVVAGPANILDMAVPEKIGFVHALEWTQEVPQSIRVKALAR